MPPCRQSRSPRSPRSAHPAAVDALVDRARVRAPSCPFSSSPPASTRLSRWWHSGWCSPSSTRARWRRASDLRRLDRVGGHQPGRRCRQRGALPSLSGSAWRRRRHPGRQPALRRSGGRDRRGQRRQLLSQPVADLHQPRPRLHPREQRKLASGRDSSAAGHRAAGVSRAAHLRRRGVESRLGGSSLHRAAVRGRPAGGPVLRQSMSPAATSPRRRSDARSRVGGCCRRAASRWRSRSTTARSTRISIRD